MDANPPSRATGFDNIFHSSHLIAEQLKDSVHPQIPYVLALYNDEVHTYDEVERMLIESVQAKVISLFDYADYMGLFWEFLVQKSHILKNLVHFGVLVG